jgi:ribosomal protein S18 acetylase RimI-like enzyme
MRDLLLALNGNMLDAASAGREVVDVGPFRAMTRVDSDLVWSNFAVPTRGGFRPEDVDALIAHFEERNRRPRLEILRDLWADLPPLLEQHGFECEYDLPLMTCTPDSFRQSAGIERAEIVTPEGDLASVSHIEGTAFGNPGPVDEALLERRRDRMREGALRVALASIEGAPAASALLMPTGEVAELAGVATLPEFRRRGLASDASSRLISDFFEQNGKIVWLSAADEAAKGTYTKLGFTQIGSQVNYIRPSAQ